MTISLFDDYLIEGKYWPDIAGNTSGLGVICVSVLTVSLKHSKMKAIIRTKAGKEFTTMEVQKIAAQPLGPQQIRVRMASSRINPVDMDLMKGFPSLKYKKTQIGGIDGAGEIVETGAKVRRFSKGDAVFFYRKFSDIGTWAEEITLDAADAALVPNQLSLEDAGAVALPLITAFEALNSLGTKAGEHILIHGAGGGVGFQAVQLAVHLGLKVIANAGERDREDLEKAGIESFIDYKQEDFAGVLAGTPPDYVFDVIGKDTLLRSLKLKPRKVVSVAFADTKKMHKTGVKLPGILKLLMNLMMAKYKRTARKNGVELIGQVSGANGKLLTAASAAVDKIDYKVRPYRRLPLHEVEASGMNRSHVGQVLIFN